MFFSLEMSKLELTQRLLASEAGIRQDKLRTGRLDEDDWHALSDALGQLGPAPLFIDDTPMTTMLEIRAKARRLKKQKGLSLVVVDYLQLMNSHQKFDSRQVEVSQISRDMKSLAMELQVPVIALSQLNRGPEARADARPMLSDLRQSGSIEQDADIVAFLYRDEMYDADTDAKGQATAPPRATLGGASFAAMAPTSVERQAQNASERRKFGELREVGDEANQR